MALHILCSTQFFKERKKEKMKKHQKHTKLNRPEFGHFGRQEWAILGTTCGTIQKLSRAIIERLRATANLAYVDADHKSADEAADSEVEDALHSGAGLSYMDMIDYHRFDTKNAFDTFQYRQWFNEQDAILVNGNHFKAQQQIVVIDPKKKESLQRKLDRLTNVQLILLSEGETEIYDFLKDHLENWQQIPVMKLSEVNRLSDWLGAALQDAKAPVYGLVLAGGKSTRMGKDKAMLEYHDMPQYQYTHQLLEAFCDKVYLSCREDQVDNFSDYEIIKDTFTGLGPFGAILSAFRENPNVAWLVMAVDLPLADAPFLKELCAARNTSKQATAILNPATDFPDPLITIWEPRSYATLLQFLAQGYSCPRKVLINSNIELIESSQAEKLKNVNHPQEFEALTGKTIES